MDDYKSNKILLDMTPESVWQDDFRTGATYFEDLVAWLNDQEQEPIPAEDLAAYDRSDWKSIQKLLLNYE